MEGSNQVDVDEPGNTLLIVIDDGTFLAHLHSYTGVSNATRRHSTTDPQVTFAQPPSSPNFATVYFIQTRTLSRLAVSAMHV